MFDWIAECFENMKKDVDTIAAKYRKQEADGTTLTEEHEKQAKSEVAAALANHVAKLSDKGNDENTASTGDNAQANNVAAGTQANASNGTTDTDKDTSDTDTNTDTENA